MQDFKLSEEKMSLLCSELKEMQECLEQSGQKVMQLTGHITSENQWTGEGAEAFLSYLELLLQYQEEFGKKSEGAVMQAVQGLEKLEEDIGSFYDEFAEYKKLEGME